MLILKRNFPNSNLWSRRLAALGAMLLSAALGCTGAESAFAAPASAGRQAADPVRAPDSVAAEFYDWYLDVLSADQDPLSDRYDRFTGYVTQDLTRQLVERLPRKPSAAPDPHPDYFLQAPSWQPAWRQGVHAALLRRERGTADVVVTLSADDAPTQVLLLAMVQEGGAWKIRRVVPAVRRGAESSAEQPVI